MIFPIIELVDRLTIAEIKFEKCLANKPELEWYRSQCSSINLASVKKELNDLRHIHLKIWDLESDLKSFCENKHSLDEIGRRAIMIRDLNHERVLLKNKIAETLGCAVREVKHNHASE